MKRASLILPTFIGCGAPKAGSTTLYRLLSLHPEIGMSRKKELYFFVRPGDKICGRKFPKAHYDKGFEWYSRHFIEFADRKALGEFSPWYFASAAVRRRIKKDLPDVKLLFVLRDPVERMYSHFRERLLHPYEPETVANFNMVEQSRFFQWYICLSQYYKHLRWWYEEFGPEQILVVLLEDLRRDQLQTLNTIAAFLRVSPVTQEMMEERVYENPGKYFRRIGFVWLKRAYYQIVPGWLRQQLQVSKRIGRVLYTPSIPKVDFELRAKLIERYFYMDIVQLQNLIGRNLENWLWPLRATNEESI